MPKGSRHAATRYTSSRRGIRAITRGREEDGVYFHFFKYAPLPALNVFGYAQGMHADVRLRAAAWTAAPLAMAAGAFKAMRVAQKRRATIMHGHWVVPGGAIAAVSRPALPLVVSLHGSDVFVAERVALARRVAGRVFRRAGAVTACSSDLATRAIALGAAPDRMDVIPYGVDTAKFAPDADARVPNAGPTWGWRPTRRSSSRRDGSSGRRVSNI